MFGGVGVYVVGNFEGVVDFIVDGECLLFYVSSVSVLVCFLYMVFCDIF